ncbi:MAG: sulfite reductase subunit alpha [Chthoniobacterales bacterium]
MSEAAVSPYSRKNPFPASLTVNRPLTGSGSQKDTRHFEIDLQGSGLEYEVGDSLGVFPTNDPALVDEILHLLELSGDEQVTSPAKEQVSLRDALLYHSILTEPSKQLLAAIGEKDLAAQSLRDIVESKDRHALTDYAWGREVIDPLLEYNVKFTADEFVAVLRKLQPRLYSIASSLKAHPDQVHLTIATVEYESFGRKRKGVCTTYLAQRVGDDDKVPVFVHKAKHFRIPEDPATDMIMVGPGTGVAPFRAFLEERKAIAAPGRNWLFFGEQHSTSEFFYRDEFEAYQKDGTLARFDTAFSRDQEHKIYVQHRLLENGADIWAWLEGGAYFYVCGDAERMAKDVEATLIEIIEIHGKKSQEEAEAWLADFKKAKRYRKDVY